MNEDITFCQSFQKRIQNGLYDKKPVGFQPVPWPFVSLFSEMGCFSEVPYDMETFGGITEQIASEYSFGENENSVVTLTIAEPLPSVKRLTEALEEHWKSMLHAAIAEAARQKPLPYLNRAMVEIEVTIPRGSDNVQLWDTSNRSIQVVFNNLKGIFFEDDNMEHMAFSVVGKWGEKGATIIRILDFDKSQQIRGIT